MSQGKMMGFDSSEEKTGRLEHRIARDLIIVIPSGVEGPLTFASASEISGAAGRPRTGYGSFDSASPFGSAALRSG